MNTGHKTIVAMLAVVVVLLVPRAATSQFADGSEQQTALNFGHSGVDDFVAVPDAQALRPTTLTVEFWVKPSVMQIGTMISKPFGAGQGDSFTLYIRPGAQEVRWWCGGAGIVTITNPLQVGRWTHFAGTHSPTEHRLYVNGELAGEGDTGGIAYDGHPFVIGADISFEQISSPFSGVIDEVRLWDVARDEDQIREGMPCRLSGNETGLIGYWPLDEGAGQVAHDTSGNGHDGVLGTSSDKDAGDPEWVVSDAPIVCEPCDADLNEDDVVDFTDLLILLAFWGPCGEVCLGDIDGDEEIGFDDLLLLLAAWGPCT